MCFVGVITFGYKNHWWIGFCVKGWVRKMMGNRKHFSNKRHHVVCHKNDSIYKDPLNTSQKWWCREPKDFVQTHKIKDGDSVWDDLDNLPYEFVNKCCEIIGYYEDGPGEWDNNND